MVTASCDALIVGGGPAGSTCAWRLVNAGLNVIVMDRADFPRDKVCAGWVTPAVVQTLRLDLDDYARSNTLAPVRRFRVGPMSAAPREHDYGEIASYGIRRCEFDDYLLRRSRASLRLGEPLKSLQRTNTGWVANDELHCRVLIGAGGHFCPVARHLGANPGRSERAVTAQEIEFRLSDEQARRCRLPQGSADIRFCDDLQGYAWVFRKGDYLNVGLGREDHESLAQHVREYLDAMKREGLIPDDAPHRMHGHAYILHGHTRRTLVDNAVLLIGDAAGLAYPKSGEGIRTAVESAVLAADTIIEAAGDYSVARLASYERRLKGRLGPGEAPAPRSALRAALGRRLLRSAWFTRRIVLDRWFLHTQQPPLVT